MAIKAAGNTVGNTVWHPDYGVVELSDKEDQEPASSIPSPQPLIQRQPTLAPHPSLDDVAIGPQIPPTEPAPSTLERVSGITRPLFLFAIPFSLGAAGALIASQSLIAALITLGASFLIGKGLQTFGKWCFFNVDHLPQSQEKINRVAQALFWGKNIPLSLLMGLTVGSVGLAYLPIGLLAGAYLSTKVFSYPVSWTNVLKDLEFLDSLSTVSKEQKEKLFQDHLFTQDTFLELHKKHNAYPITGVFSPQLLKVALKNSVEELKKIPFEKRKEVVNQILSHLSSEEEEIVILKQKLIELGTNQTLYQMQKQKYAWLGNLDKEMTGIHSPYLSGLIIASIYAASFGLTFYSLPAATILFTATALGSALLEKGAKSAFIHKAAKAEHVAKFFFWSQILRSTSALIAFTALCSLFPAVTLANQIARFVTPWLAAGTTTLLTSDRFFASIRPNEHEPIFLKRSFTALHEILQEQAAEDAPDINMRAAFLFECGRRSMQSYPRSLNLTSLVALATEKPELDKTTALELVPPLLIFKACAESLKNLPKNEEEWEVMREALQEMTFDKNEDTANFENLKNQILILSTIESEELLAHKREVALAFAHSLLIK